MDDDDDDCIFTTDVDPQEIAQLANEDLASAIKAEAKSLDGMTRLEARAWIDRKTYSLQQSMTALSTIRNTLAPIHDLPDEILVEIIWQLSQSVRADVAPPGDIGRKTSISWLAVTKVCRRWRNIALGTPKLYTFVDARNTLALQMFLEKSCNLPIHVYMHSAASTVGLDVHAIKLHLHRVNKFEFFLRWSSMQEVLRQLGSFSAPLLESLHLETTAIRRVLAFNEAVVVSTPFNGQTPALRRLYLSHVSIPWSSRIFTGLTGLHLLFQHSSTTPTIEEFIKVLQNCHLLESLTLVQAGPSLGPDVLEYPTTTCIVELPCLLQLYLQLRRPIDMQYVLAHLGTPPNTFITICCQLELSDQDLSHVLPLDCEALKGFSEVRSLKFHIEDVQSISLTGYARETGAKIINMSLFLGEDEGILKPRLFFSKLDRFFPLSLLDGLEMVNCAQHLSKNHYVEVFSKLPKLYQLAAIEEDPARQRQLLAALTMSPIGRSEGVTIPHLKVLRFAGLESTQEAVNDVASVCRFRASNGAALGILHYIGLDSEGILVLLDEGIIVHVDEKWVEEVLATSVL